MISLEQVSYYHVPFAQSFTCQWEERHYCGMKGIFPRFGLSWWESLHCDLEGVCIPGQHLGCLIYYTILFSTVCRPWYCIKSSVLKFSIRISLTYFGGPSGM